MYRHERDAVSLILGLLLCTGALLFLLNDTTSVDPGWAAAIALIGVGVAGVAATVRHGAKVVKAQQEIDKD